MRIILAPDSFKGSLSAEDFCTVLAPLLQARAPMAQIIRLPLADGGEGTLRCLMRVLGGTIRFFQTTGALGDPLRAPVGFLPDHTAVMESAGVVGLPGVRGRENPEISSTWGLGVLMRKAVENGAKKILLTLGGTATNDLGLGMLAAMGYRFLNAAGEAFIPTGATMGSIVHVIRTRDFLPFESISFSVMCDVKNPLLGAGGAAAVFAPQKGADPAMVARLERQAQQAVKLLGSEEAMAEGAGAGGGLGYACLRFLNATMQSGIDTVLSLYRFDRLLEGCGLIITGEGCFDRQSAMGKVLGTVIRRAENIPVVVFAGKVKPFERSAFPNLKEVYEISAGQPPETAMRLAKENLRRAFDASKLPYPYIPVPPCV